jgi:2'-5' RNA ligase
MQPVKAEGVLLKYSRRANRDSGARACLQPAGTAPASRSSQLSRPRAGGTPAAARRTRRESVARSGAAALRSGLASSGRCVAARPIPLEALIPSGSTFAKAFDELWDRFAPQVVRGESAVDITSDLPIYTAVARLDRRSADSLCRRIEPLRGALADHYVYPASDLHLTLLSLTPYVQARGDGETAHRLDTARAALTDVISDSPAPAFTISGLGLFPTTVFAQLIPEQGVDFAEIRRRLARALHARGLGNAAAEHFERHNRWELCFINVVRFTQPADPTVVSAIAPMREVPLGTATFGGVQMVRTDKFLSMTGTQILDEFAFAPRRGS